VQINFILMSPITLPADHYFFVPQAKVNGTRPSFSGGPVSALPPASVCSGSAKLDAE
jgi:hypothetical protein